MGKVSKEIRRAVSDSPHEAIMKCFRFDTVMGEEASRIEYQFK